MSWSCANCGGHVFLGGRCVKCGGLEEAFEPAESDPSLAEADGSTAGATNGDGGAHPPQSEARREEIWPLIVAAWRIRRAIRGGKVMAEVKGKPWWKSKTVWGSVLGAVALAMTAVPVTAPFAAAVGALAALLTGTGVAGKLERAATSNEEMAAKE